MISGAASFSAGIRDNNRITSFRAIPRICILHSKQPRRRAIYFPDVPHNKVARRTVDVSDSR